MGLNETGVFYYYYCCYYCYYYYFIIATKLLSVNDHQQ